MLAVGREEGRRERDRSSPNCEEKPDSSIVVVKKI